MADSGRFYVRLSVARHAVDETAASRVAWADGRYAHTLEQALDEATNLVAALKAQIAENFNRGLASYARTDIVSPLPDIAAEQPRSTAPLRSRTSLNPEPWKDEA